MARKKRKSKQLQSQRYFMIYVSGAYEEVYMKWLHSILHEQCKVNLFVRCYEDGEDFGGGFEMLDKDLKSQRVTKNLERAEAILIQGDMDVEAIVKRFHEFEHKAKTYRRTVYLVPSIRAFESWLKAHFTPINNQNEIVSKTDIDQWIRGYSQSVDNAQQYFKNQTNFKLIIKAAHPNTGNHSFRKFLEKLGVLDCLS
jgi:hypothetical protein